MKICKYVLFALIISVIGMSYAYASCYDWSSCHSELENAESSRESSTTHCRTIEKNNDMFAKSSDDVCSYVCGVLCTSARSSAISNGYKEIFTNCLGSVWCKDYPVNSDSSSSSSYDSDYSSSYTSNSSYSSSYSGYSSHDYDDDDEDSLYFRSLSDKEGVYEINKNHIDVGYYGNISYGYPDGEGNIFYYDDMVYVGSFKLGTPHGSGVLLTKNGYMSGRWTYGVFRQSRTLPASLLPLTTAVSRKSRILANKMLFVKYFEIDADSRYGRLLLNRFGRSCRSYY